MVKKLSLSPKKDISKNHHQEKKQLSCLINVLRPKVYITDTSNFKKLVQELTGNTTTTKTTTARTSTKSSSSSSPPDHHQSHKIDKLVLPVIDLVDQDQDDLQLFLADQEIMGQLDNNCYMDDQTRMYDASFDHLSPVNSKEEGLLLAAYQDLESWLLQDSDGQETEDPCHIYNYDYNYNYNYDYSYNYGQFGDQQEQVSIYDYQLSGLI